MRIGSISIIIKNSAIELTKNNNYINNIRTKFCEDFINITLINSNDHHEYLKFLCDGLIYNFFKSLLPKKYIIWVLAKALCLSYNLILK